MRVFGWIGRGVAGMVLCLANGVQATELVLAEVHPPAHLIVRVEESLAARVAELTQGKLTIQIKHSAQLGTESQSWINVRKGAPPLVRVNFAELAADVPSARLLSLPYLFRSREHMWKVLNGDFGQRLKSEIEKTGAMALAYYENGTRSFYTTKQPIQKRSDFAGQRIRVQNSPVYKDLITELGGTPLVVPYDKVIDAFRKGEIDGAENNLPSYVSSEHYKYAKYFSMDEHSSVPEVLLIAKKAWDELPPEQQKALAQAAAESSTYMQRLWAEYSGFDFRTKSG